MVLLTNLMPPVYEHAHAGGEAFHTHGRADRHRHDHDHHGDDGRDGEQEAELIAGAVAHAHWTFLFFSVTWPADDDDRRAPGQWGDSLAGPAYSRAEFCMSFVGQYDGPLSRNWADFLQARATAYSCATAVEQRPAGRSLIPDLLCDTARHERSGVQLI
jgi:hypothetical protein